MLSLRSAIVCVVMAMATTAASADPARWSAEGWKTDFSRATVDLDSIRSGGPPRDGIPSIDDPVFISVADEKALKPAEPVIALLLNGETKAYPLRILTWHEIANDVIGGVPVAVTYCPLCNASIVFDRRIEGKAVEFGTTGKLRNSDLVMYDRATDSWWQQFTGEAIAGVHTGKKLQMLPSAVMAWRDFAAAHPGGLVLQPNNPDFRPYGRNPYAGYDTASRPFLYDGALPAGINPMARVVIARTDDKPLIVTLERVRAGGYSAGGIRFEWSAGVNSALDAPSIAEGRDVGAVQVTRDGKPVVHDVTFAFVAHAFHPDVAIAGAD